jgi:hypothetical protein
LEERGLVFSESQAKVKGGKNENEENIKLKKPYVKKVHTILLVSIERPLKTDSLKGVIDAVYDEKYFRGLIEAQPEFKFLFKYVFPLPRMLSLLTIYSSEALAKSQDGIVGAFDETKGALRNLFYTLRTDEDDIAQKWWQDDGIMMEEDKDAVSERKRQEDNLSTLGTPNLASMALRTVPLLIRGTAEQMDPHYMLVSRLSDAGVLPTGKTWGSVPPLWPVNFFGWGPPLGPWGMMAYSMPLLPGDKKGPRDFETAKKQVEFATSPDEELVNCDEEE